MRSARCSRALAIRETADTQALFVRNRPSPSGAARHRGFPRAVLAGVVGAAGGASTIWRRSRRNSSSRRRRSVHCIKRAVEAWPRRLPADELFGPSGLAADCGRSHPAQPPGNRDHRGPRSRTVSDQRALCDAADRVGRRSVVAGRSKALGLCLRVGAAVFRQRVRVCVDRRGGCDAAQQLRDKVARGAGVGRRHPRDLARRGGEPIIRCARCPGADALLDRTWSDRGYRRARCSRCASRRGSRDCAPRSRPSRRSRTRCRARCGNSTRKIPIRAGRRPTRRRKRCGSTSTCAANSRPPTFRRFGKSELDVLIAGCGTGQHAIENAPRFPGARTLAIDLSLTSLAYALRKTRELGVPNLEYAPGRYPQARRASAATFDVIEFERRAASSRRSVRRMARAAVAVAAGRLHGGRVSTARSRAPASSRRGPSSPNAAMARPPTTFAAAGRT